MNVPKIEVVDFGSNCFWSYVYLSIVFSAYYQWWICLLVWLLSSFFYIDIFTFSFSSFCECVCACFFVWFCLYRFAFTICPRVLSVRFFVLFFFVFCLFVCFFSLFLFFWAVWLARSSCSGWVSGLRLWGGRAESRTLDHQKFPSPM